MAPQAPSQLSATICHQYINFKYIYCVCSSSIWDWRRKSVANCEHVGMEVANRCVTNTFRYDRSHQRASVLCVCVGIIAVCYFARNQIPNRLYNQLFYLHILSVAHLHRQSLKHRRCQRRRPSWDRASETETYLRTHTLVQRKSNWKERMTHSYASTYLNQHQPKIV